MDTKRFILVISLSMLSMMLWQEWQKDYGMPDQQTQDIAQFGEQPVLPTIQKQDDIPVVPAGSSMSQAPQQVAKALSRKTAKRVTVNTDVFHIEIDLQGAGIRLAELKDYPVAIDKPDQPLLLLGETESMFYVTQGGLLGTASSPTHEDIFSSARHNYSLAEGSNTLEVPLTWVSDQGLKVTKIFVFTRASHLINIRYVIENGGAQTWEGRSYAQINRNDPGGSRRRIIYTYTGAVLSSPDKRYEKISFDDMHDQTLDAEIVNGWVAMIEHYFVTALVPKSTTESYRYYTNTTSDNRNIIGAFTPVTLILSGDTGTIEEQLYIGPKTQKILSEISEGLELTVDYGVLWFIAKPLFWCLTKAHEMTGNWGWSIILVTMLLKILFYRLSAAGYRSMANMRRVQPRIISIKDRYQGDKTRLNQAMMQIYKEEKINPLGGCFPILIQIPVFISLYWVLLESVEMRQASFIFWLNDLSSPDRFYVLPLLMGITMFIQQKLNPAPMDPVQAKVMTVLPIVFTVFFAFFPSGLVLYWVVNNVLSIAQQWLISRNLERAGLKPKAS